jgi:ubiquinone/menaquinone biosynthesis C-methylase UbiE
LNIPVESNKLDYIFSFDVLEHVENPVNTLDEFYRILEPGGKVFIIFTPYYGAFSHHLNYISKIPFLHWFFSPKTLVAAINDILTSPTGAIYNTALQPNPILSFNGKRMVLPTLNGLTSKEFYKLILSCGFQIEEFRQISLFGKFLSKFGLNVNFNLPLHKTPLWKIQEGLSFNLVAVLRKP